MKLSTAQSRLLSCAASPRQLVFRTARNERTIDVLIRKELIVKVPGSGNAFKITEAGRAAVAT